ncbi:MAG: cysteine--tRNA ligase [Chloroflexota bacterium]|nr:cysteine--tRNA ligase [Chloroflexota bacterium]
MRIYDTLESGVREFAPMDGDKVRMYVCGITPYAEAHVGHAMQAIVFDAARRYLEHRGYAVLHVQNFTDIDDKLIERASREGAAVADLAERHIAAYFRMLEALNVRPAHHYPRATEQTPQMLEIIGGLVSQGAAYAAGGDVYFRVARAPGYGKLSRRSLETMRAGARIEASAQKEHPMDFVLWKAAKPGEPSWESPWGPGRPGWHIECSAMALNYLGRTLDIHGGGQDLVFPHHENEIAQSEAFNDGQPLARFWMHNGMMLLGQEKMSKSLGNLVTIAEALAAHSTDALRHLILSSHYRSPAVYSDELMAASGRAVARLRQALAASSGGGAAFDPEPYRARFIEAMDDDFGTPQALAALFDLARAINRAVAEGGDARDAQQALRTLGEEVIGFTFAEPQASLDPELARRIQDLVDRRAHLRAERRFAEADAIRDELAAMDVSLTDSPEGAVWRVAQ